MKVSVIVPVYNVENVLHYCVDSILSQTYKDFELILIDDGSTDKSGKICDEYATKDPRITAIHITNGGVSNARNTGVDYASGDCICFIDSDDYIADNYLEVLIKAKKEYKEFDNIWCGFQTTTDYNKSNCCMNLASKKEKISTYNRSKIMTLHEKWLSQMPWNKLFITSIIKDNMIRFPEDLTLGEDLIFNLKYLDKSNGKIFIINKPLYFYIQTGEESLDNKFYPDLFKIYKCINSEICDYLVKWHCKDDQLSIYYNFCFYSYEKVLRNTFHSKSNIANKYKYNIQILKSNEFRNALEKSDCYINKYYHFAFKHSSYRLVRALDWITKLRK